MPDHPYRGRMMALATAHAKGEAIAPVLAARLGIRLIVPPRLDTDRLGTFSGEIERPGTVDEVLARKTELGLAATGLGCAIASEGSYGPHPHMPFLAAGMEHIVLIDAKRGHRIQESLFDDHPVYETVEVNDPAALTGFIASSRFPSHAAIVQPAGAKCTNLTFKGIRDRDALDHAVRQCIEASPQRTAQVQTDMRAHMNPTRMQTIARLADRFAERLLALCPACAVPGYGRTGVLRGLPCADCGWPTDLVRAEVHGCAACGHAETRPRSDGLRETQPRNCPDCNP